MRRFSALMSQFSRLMSFLLSDLRIVPNIVSSIKAKGAAPATAERCLLLHPTAMIVVKHFFYSLKLLIMGYVKDNNMMDGMSGTIGKLTFSVRKNKTVSSPRRGRNTKPPTEEQLAVQLRFERFSAYAMKAIADPVKRLLYEKGAKGGQTAFNAAFRDAALPPKILEIDTGQYKGVVGNVITLLVKDIIPVSSVTVTILSAAGTELEHGDAIFGVANYWNYTVTTANPALPGTRILITATDLPGNITNAEKVI